MSERLLYPAIFFSFILQSHPVHVFQSILLNQPRLKFIYFCTYFLDLSRFERQSREKDSQSNIFSTVILASHSFLQFVAFIGVVVRLS